MEYIAYPDFRDQTTRPDLASIMKKVESLGSNCELGLVQRHCDAESVGLFRFGYTPIEGLISAIASDFDGIGEIDDIGLEVGSSNEWIAKSKRYGFEFHTEHYSPDTSEDDVRKKMRLHFGFLSRKLREDLQGAEKLFFFRPHNHGPVDDDAYRLLASIRKFGASILVWVDISSDLAKTGTAEWTVPGSLITAYLDRYSYISFAAGASFDVWIQIVASSINLANDFSECTGP